MKRKNYQCPTTAVIDVCHQAGPLMTSPGVNATKPGYGTAETDEWG